MIVAAVLVVLAAVAVGVAVPLTRDGLDTGTWPGIGSHTSTGGHSTGDTRIETGPAHEIARGALGAEGGTMVVEKSGSYLDGMMLEVPAGAYASAVEVRIAESPITGLHLEAELEAATPLIEISGADSYADGLITLQIPVTVLDDEVAMAFLYDPERGTLEAVPAVELTSSSLTVATRHFSKYVVLKGKKVYLDHLSLPRKGTPAYLPGKDTWSIPNTGSYVAPGGFCRGMALSSVWYFTQQNYSSGDGLWKPEYENGLDPSRGTPGFWQDDSWAIQLCSLAQHVWKTQTGIETGAEYRRKLGEAGFPIDVFYQVALALAANPGEPVLLALYEGPPPSPTAGGTAAPVASSGHSVVCYGIEGHTLKIADPNLPEVTDLTIEYRDGGLRGFTTFDNTADMLLGRSRTYPFVEFDGLTSFYDLGVLRELWTAYEAGSIEDYRLKLPGRDATPASFPDYSIEITTQDKQGTDTGTRVLDLNTGARVTDPFITFALRPTGFEGELTIYRFGDLENPVLNSAIPVEPGENLFGLYVQGKTAGGLWWTGFDWVTITGVTETPELAPLNYTKCRVGLVLTGVVWERWDDGTNRGREQSDEPAYWGFEAEGAFAGNEFTGTWIEVRDLNLNWAPGMPLPGDTARRGRVTVMVDPETHDVISFRLDNTFEEPDSNLGTGTDVAETIVGGRLRLVEEKPTSTGLYARWEEETDGGTPPAQFTYVVNQGTGPRDVDGLLDHRVEQVWLYLYKLP